MTTTMESRRAAASRNEPTDPAAMMRSVLGHFCTGVAVITGAVDSAPVGMTVQSLVSISLEPPLVMFSPQKTSTTWPRIRRGGVFSANILGEDQKDLCRSFSKSAEDKFDGVAWRAGRTGAPILDDALAFIECEIESVYEAGDHYMVLGKVLDLGVASPGTPLLFYRGGFGSFTAHPRPGAE
ncbi:flavin reductase family protein [Arthrobacter sp. MA-N2]|uniref:flavin reductase family protein n=1 Tax=Arthrobacter sp. MA-N2 TaxID=1101188 RepID=UPI0004B88DD2|nr:flavin reductase family protein [Arthrobacter sp. MA-N2]